VASTRPGEVRPPHPVAQGVLEAFLERSVGRYGPVDGSLAALFADAVDVGVLRAGVVYEDGTPVGLCRLDARLVPRTYRGFVGEPAHGLVAFSVNVWEHAPAEQRAQMQALLADSDADTWRLAPVVRHLQGRCRQLLGPLLQRVLAAQGVRGALAACRFTDPLEPEAVRVRPTAPSEAEAVPEAAVQSFPGGVRLRIPAGMTRQDLLEECVDAAERAAQGLSNRSIAGRWPSLHGRKIDDKTAGRMVRVGQVELAERAAQNGVRNDRGSAELRK
jgi:hypothetical protein